MEVAPNGYTGAQISNGRVWRMLARCVNPDCHAPLQSFCEGRLFQFEVVSLSISVSDEAFNETPERDTTHFWLCGRCASELTLVLEAQRGLRLLPLNQEAKSSYPAFPGFDEEQIENHNC